MPIAKYDHGNIFYQEEGKGEPVVLIHGVGLDHTMWHKQINELSKCLRVIAYDMLGHGKSEKLRGPYTLSQFVDQLSGLLHYLNVKTCHVVGFSMGGMVAQAFALKNRSKMKTLTLMSAVANRTAEQRSAILKRVNEVKIKGPDSTIEPAIQRWFNKEFLQANEETVNQIRATLRKNNPASYLSAYALFATADQELWPQLEQINVPTLIVTGENDAGSTPYMSRQMHERIKASELQIVPNIKHMLPMEGSGLINDMILSFTKERSSIFRRE